MATFPAPAKATRNALPIDVMWIYVIKGHAQEAAAKAGLAARHAAIFPGLLTATKTGATYDLVKAGGVTAAWLSEQSWIGAVAKAITPAGYGRSRINLNPTGETRAILVEAADKHLTGIGPIRINCERIAEAGFNLIIDYIWHGEGSHWPSSHVRFQSDPDFSANHAPGTDDFMMVLDEARGYGIDVLAGLTCTLRSNSDIHPEWSAGSNPEGHYDSHDPDFISWLTDGVGYAGTGTAGLIKEIVDNYGTHPAFRGLFLDYIRTGAGAYLNPIWQAAYTAFNGRNMVADHGVMVTFGDDELDDKLEHRDSPAYALCLWQDLFIGDIVRRSRRLLKASNQRHVMTTYGDPFEGGSMDQGRVPAKWLEDGDVDIAYRNAYRIYQDPPDPNITWGDFSTDKDALTTLGRGNHMVTVEGNYDVNLETGAFVKARLGTSVNASIVKARSIINSPNGISLYLYNQFQADQKEAVKAGAFLTHVPPSYIYNGMNLMPLLDLAFSMPDATVLAGSPAVLDVQEMANLSGTNISSFTGTYEAPAGTTELLFAFAGRVNSGSTVTGLSGTFGATGMTQLVEIQDGAPAKQNLWLGSISSPSGSQSVTVTVAPGGTGGGLSSGKIVAVALKNTAASSIYGAPQVRADAGTAALHSFNETAAASAMILYLVSFNQFTTNRVITPDAATVQLFNAKTNTAAPSGIHTVFFIGHRSEQAASTYAVGASFSAADNFAAACIEIAGVG